MPAPELKAIVRHRTVATGGLHLHLAEAGEGPPVVLLHGFPEFWYSWRHQLVALAAAGYHAVAPDLRGYNQSDRPSGVSRYRTRELVADVVGLIESLTQAPVLLVGHDWGGVIAWRVAALHPERLRGLAILNAPHPGSFRQELMRSPMQWIRSSYTALFQLPWIPEQLLTARSYGIIARTLRRQPVDPEAFTERDIAHYQLALSQSGLTGPLNYYRAAARHPGDLFSAPQQVHPQTLVIWGERDPYLSRRLATQLSPWVPQAEVHLLPHASHWVQNETPTEVNSLLLEFASRLKG